MWHCKNVNHKMRKQTWKPNTDIVPCQARNLKSNRCAYHDEKSLREFCILFNTYSAMLCVDSRSSAVNSFPDGQVRHTNLNKGETDDDRRTNRKIR